jgi:hypothetical protein
MNAPTSRIHLFVEVGTMSKPQADTVALKLPLCASQSKA